MTGLGSSLTGAAKVWWKRNKIRHPVGQIYYIFTVDDMGARLDGLGILCASQSHWVDIHPESGLQIRYTATA